MSEPKLTIVDKPILNQRQSVNPELLFFKNDILGDLKQIESKLSKKIIQESDERDRKLIDFQNRLDALTQKLFNLSNTTSENTLFKEKLESLYQFRSKIESTINNLEFKLNTTTKELVDAINKYDRIVNNNIFYQGVVGSSNAKFRNLHDFIDYVLTNISQLNIFKDKIVGIDFKNYQAKLDSMIIGLNKQIKEIISNNKIFTIRCIDDLEQKMKSHFNLYEQKVFELKIRNTEECNDLQRLTQNLIKEWEKISTIKNEIDVTFAKYNDNYRHHHKLTESKLNECLKEYNEMKRKFDLLIEFMKGVKSGVGGGFGSNITFSDFINLKENSHIHKTKSTAVSYLKKYIVGEVGMDQISQLSRKYTKKINPQENNQFVNNNFSQNQFMRKNTMNTISHFGFNNNNMRSQNSNSEQINNKLNKSISQGLLMNNNFNNSLSKSIKVTNKSVDEKILKDDDKKKSSFKRYNTSKFINDSLKKNNTNDSPNLKVEFKDTTFKNNIISLNKTINVNLDKDKLKIDNQNNNIVNKTNDNDIQLKDEDNKNDLIAKNKINYIDFDNIKEIKEEKIEINEDEDTEETKKLRSKRMPLSKSMLIKKKEKIENEDDKIEKKYKSLVKNHTNILHNEYDELINQKDDNEINNKNSIIKNSNISNNNEVYIIIENEEKEDEKEENIKIDGNEAEYNGRCKNNVEKNNNIRNSAFLDRKNNIDINNFEDYTNNDYDSVNNMYKTYYDKNNYIDVMSSKNTIYNEREKRNNSFGNANIRDPNIINPKDKINLHKLLKGNINAIKSFQIKNSKGEELRLHSVKNKKNDKQKINLNDIKNQILSKTIYNFYPSKNSVNKDNNDLCEDSNQYNNLQYNNNYNSDRNFYSNDNRENDKNEKNEKNEKKVNKMNNTEFNSLTTNRESRNKIKLNIVNLPELVNKKKENFLNPIKNYNESFNQILQLRKINYDNDLYRKNKGPKINSRNINNYDKYNTRTYNGFGNNNINKNGSF